MRIIIPMGVFVKSVQRKEEIQRKKSKNMPTYTKITLEEMKNFLEPQGFTLHKRDDRTEYVANKIQDGNIIRVYTSINPEDRSRRSGDDAIRVGVFDSHGNWMFGQKRVNRTENWKENVQDRINKCILRLHK